MLEQPVHQFAAWIFLLLGRRHRIPRQQHLRLDMNQNGGHVNKFRGYVHVEIANLLDISQILGSNLRNGNVVDVYVLFANQVEQQIQGPFVNVGNGNCKRKVALVFF